MAFVDRCHGVLSICHKVPRDGVVDAFIELKAVKFSPKPDVLKHVGHGYFRDPYIVVPGLVNFSFFF
jgi:hypothetical protein